MEHSNLATAYARIFFVYIEPGAVDLPDRCCTLSISPLLRELIIELSDRVEDDDGRGASRSARAVSPVSWSGKPG
jgi:hypothetical protein